MTNPLDSSNPYGIRVVANRGPDRPEARAAFAKAARKATAGINSLTQPRRRSTRAVASAKRAK